MLKQPDLDRIAASLRDRMMARIGMRWKKAGAYMPSGSTRVLCANELPEADQAIFDAYVLAYQDAIADMMDMLDTSAFKPERPLALAMVENSIFQDGSMPRGGRRRIRVDKPPRGQIVEKMTKSQARERAESLFRKGGGDDV